MLLRPHTKETPPPRYKNHLNDGFEAMTITYWPELALFLQDIDLSSGIFTVTYNPPDGESKSLEIPLKPEVSDLETMTAKLHNSPAKAYKMNKEINTWFSSCFGYDVILAYIGTEKRPVLGNLSPNAVPKKPAQSWLSSLTPNMPTFTGKPKEGLTFTDCAPYLVVTEESLRETSSRLPAGMEVDVTKFRPSIVVSGTAEAWDEDYWGAVQVSNSGKEYQIVLTANCLRCVSLNVDYETGQAAKGEEGTVLKKLMRDRRVDKGNKYSPVFGRYGFLDGAAQTIAVGDEVVVSKRNEERTTFGKTKSNFVLIFIADSNQNGLACERSFTKATLFQCFSIFDPCQAYNSGNSIHYGSERWGLR